MNKHVTKALLGTSAAALFTMTSCNEEDGGPVDFLVGEWEVTVERSEGIGRLNGIGENYTLIFEFDADGEFSYCYKRIFTVGEGNKREDDAGTKTCLFGDFERDEEDDLIINLDFSPEDIFDRIELETLTATEMSGDIIDEETNGEEIYTYTASFTAVKVED